MNAAATGVSGGAAPSSAGAPPHPPVLPFAIMCMGMFVALLDIQIVAASLQDIGGGLSAGQDQIGWLQTAYLIAEIIVIPMSGWLTRVFSTRWLFSVSALGFTVASLLCGLAWNIESMIVFRALQGLIGASMIPTVFTSTFHYFPGKRQPLAAATVATIASVAPALGPVIGGWITDTLSWRWIFYINLAPGLLVALSTASLVDIDEPDLSLLKGADYPGIALLAVFLGFLEYVLEEGSRWNWFDDAGIRRAAWIAGAGGVLFVWRSLVFPRPVVDLRALGNRNFLIGCILSFITGMGIFSTIYLLPLFLGYVRGLSALQTGSIVCATGLGALLGVPVYVALARRVDARLLMTAGLAMFGLSMLSFSRITSDWDGDQLFWPQIIRGFPQVFAVAPAVTLGLGSLAMARLKYASGLFNMMRNLGGAVGIALCGAILNNRTNLHFDRIATAFNSANAAMQSLLDGTQARYGQVLGDAAHAQAAALAQLRALAYREASTMAYADAFIVIATAFALAVLLAPMLRKVGARPAGTDTGH
ncbi:MDR family MFS transporter [Achromobacter aloeverae]|uniref:EmrB/QacA family drug resistance transporter n=1 Tax=Achromobacter aloeverae TaxID=1750518 RepID=A0A4Q1HK25_9BURK|nr:MDR family MFS transporter [Achromobacter aloeverae]RXN86943.1 EmrB/QacA family drug resistance transporter [Achromobacter aloeverae]